MSKNLEVRELVTRTSKVQAFWEEETANAKYSKSQYSVCKKHQGGQQAWKELRGCIVKDEISELKGVTGHPV